MRAFAFILPGLFLAGPVFAHPVEPFDPRHDLEIERRAASRAEIKKLLEPLTIVPGQKGLGPIPWFGNPSRNAVRKLTAHLKLRGASRGYARVHLERLSSGQREGHPAVDVSTLGKYFGHAYLNYRAARDGNNAELERESAYQMVRLMREAYFIAGMSRGDHYLDVTLPTAVRIGLGTVGTSMVLAGLAWTPAHLKDPFVVGWLSLLTAWGLTPIAQSLADTREVYTPASWNPRWLKQTSLSLQVGSVINKFWQGVRQSILEHEMVFTPEEREAFKNAVLAEGISEYLLGPILREDPKRFWQPCYRWLE